MLQDSQQLKARPVNRWYWLILLVIITFAACVRIRLLDVPLERDEGEYAYAGQLILDGVPPYSQVYNVKMPGIYAAYALILAVFGQTQTAIHLGLLIVNAITIFVVFLLAKKLFDPLAALAAAAAFAMLSIGQMVQGVFANAEHFVILPALCGILLLLYALDTKKIFVLLAAAFLLGLAFIIKQHGAAFIAFAGLFLLFCEIRRRPFNWKRFIITNFVFYTGVLLPFTMTCLILWKAGVFGKFWFWVFDYGLHYASGVTLSTGLIFFKNNAVPIVQSTALLHALALGGLFCLFFNKKARCMCVFSIGFLVFSFLAACPGFYFRPHYFILMLPAVALLVGVAVYCIQELSAKRNSIWTQKAVPILIFLTALGHAVYQQFDFLFVLDPISVVRTVYYGHPFAETVEVARFIKECSAKDNRIAVIGSEPQILFYAQRRSATGHIYFYPLMEEAGHYAKKMQQEMIDEIEQACPKFMVVVNYVSSLLVRQQSEKMIILWLQQYINQFYEQIGVVDVISLENTIYLWKDDAAEYTPKSEQFILVFRRKANK